MARCSTTTPLGSPVDPDVKTMYAASAGRTVRVGRRSSAPPAPSSRQTSAQGPRASGPARAQDARPAQPAAGPPDPARLAAVLVQVAEERGGADHEQAGRARQLAAPRHRPSLVVERVR